EAFCVVRVTGAYAILDAAFLHDSRKTYQIVAATAEAHTDHTNLSLMVFLAPPLGLIDELLVPSFCASVVRVTLGAIQHATNKVIFGAGARNVTAAEALVACTPQRLDLVIDLGNIGLMLSGF